MDLFCDAVNLELHGRNLAQLLLVGGCQLETLAKRPPKVTYAAWAAAVTADAARRNLTVLDGQMLWLWEALTTEPTIHKELGMRIVSRDEEWRRQQPVAVLNTNDRLGIFFKRLSCQTVIADAKPDAVVMLNEVLCMRPGKGTSRRYECMDVSCVVMIEAENTGSTEAEAALMKIDLAKVSIEENMVCANVGSLNHAYTKASLRCEPNRRGPGGRAYDHLAWNNGKEWISLEEIRTKVEAGTWTYGLGLKLPKNKGNQDSPGLFE